MQRRRSVTLEQPLGGEMESNMALEHTVMSQPGYEDQGKKRIPTAIMRRLGVDDPNVPKGMLVPFKKYLGRKQGKRPM